MPTVFIAFCAIAVMTIGYLLRIDAVSGVGALMFLAASAIC